MASVKEDNKRPVEEIYNSLPEATQEWVDTSIVKVWFYFSAWCFYMLISSIVIGFVFLDDITHEPIGKRIQRLGAIIPFVAVLGEALFIGKINKLASVIHPAQLACEIYMQRRFKILVSGTMVFTFIIVAVGSVFSGYGDFLFSL